MKTIHDNINDFFHIHNLFTFIGVYGLSTLVAKHKFYPDRKIPQPLQTCIIPLYTNEPIISIYFVLIFDHFYSNNITFDSNCILIEGKLIKNYKN